VSKTFQSDFFEVFFLKKHWSTPYFHFVFFKNMKRARRNGSCEKCDAGMTKCSFIELNVDKEHEEDCDKHVCAGSCSLVPELISAYLNIHNDEVWRLCHLHMAVVKRMYLGELVKVLRADPELKESLDIRIKIA
jgi:hypothetical protein